MKTKVICRVVRIEAHSKLQKTSPHTFIQYCSFAMTGLSEMKVRRVRFQVKGMGMISDMKTTISKTRSPKTRL